MCVMCVCFVLFGGMGFCGGVELKKWVSIGIQRDLSKKFLVLWSPRSQLPSPLVLPQY